MLTMDLPKNVKIAVAVSGGVDSVVLLHKLVQLSAERGFSLSVVHCEHGIRGEESRKDAEFVRALAQDYGLEYTQFSEDCIQLANRLGVSLETAAREFRYRSFESLLADGRADYIALAHHLDDSAETTLFRLCRGTSLGGLLGMSKQRGKYLRPLLDVKREEIEAYAKAQGLAYRVDQSNFERCATRNVLRLDVLPALENAVPGAKLNLAAFARRAKEDDMFLTSLAEELIEEREAVSSGCLKEYARVHVRVAPSPILRRACLLVLKAFGVERDYTHRHLQALEDLFSSQTGAKAVLPKGVRAVREYDTICFYRETGEAQKPSEEAFRLGEFGWGRVALNISLMPMEGVLYADLEAIPQGAVIRARREGDVFCPYGGKGKPLKKYLIDKKIPMLLRDELPLLAIENEVLAVLGVEIAEKIKVTENTKKTVYFAVGSRKITKDGK